MKGPIFLLWYIFLCKLLTDFRVDADCDFRYKKFSNMYRGHCLCGPENQTVSWRENKYCCVQNQDTCKVTASSKLCPNATVLYDYQPCHGTCGSRKIQCPSNPNYCMDRNPFGSVPACDGQQRCEESCSGSIEKFPYHNNCNYRGRCFYCGKRDGAKFHNFQCSCHRDLFESKLSYSCLNRVDIAEERIRESVIYDSKISNRKNLFEIFKANNTMNSVNQTHIVCGDKTLKLYGDKAKGHGGSIHCKEEKNDNKEIPVTDFDVISAFDFLQDRGLKVDHTQWVTNQFMYPLGMSLHYQYNRIEQTKKY